MSLFKHYYRELIYNSAHFEFGKQADLENKQKVGYDIWAYRLGIAYILSHKQVRCQYEHTVAHKLMETHAEEHCRLVVEI